MVVEGVDSEEECERLVACEVPGGAIRLFNVFVSFPLLPNSFYSLS